MNSAYELQPSAHGSTSSQYENAYNADEDDGFADGDPEMGQDKIPPPTTSDGQTAPMNQLGWFSRIPIPLSIITSVTALWVIIGSLLDIIIDKAALADFIIDCYFIFFGFCLMLMVMPTAFSCLVFLESPRSGVEKWSRFITTHWGRGYFMIFICILAFGRENFFRISMGIILVLTGILSIWCGRLAAQKFNRLKEYLAAGCEGDAFRNSVKDKASGVLIDGGISEGSLRSLIEQSGRRVTPSEVHAIFCFFDRERKGTVELEIFIDILDETERQKSL